MNDESPRRYWLTPPELEVFREGKWDPFPYPLPEGWDALQLKWQKPWYANPPFAQYTRFVRKAIEEGGPGILVGPCPDAIALLLDAGAEYIGCGRFAWLEVTTKKPMPHPGTSAIWQLPSRNAGESDE